MLQNAENGVYFRMNNIDLHTHSTFSDGSEIPAVLVEEAVGAELTAVALTDHDTVAGLKDFQLAARAFPRLEAVNGVEISTSYGQCELHITGLFIAPDNAELLDFLAGLRRERMERARLMSARLASLGYPVDIPGLDGDGTKPIGRPHFARAIAENYRFASIADVFNVLLKRGCPGYVARRLPPPEAAIDAIHRAGGCAVWAHPISGPRSEHSWVNRMCGKLAAMGLDGVEAWYTTFSPQQTNIVRIAADRNGLLCAGGSDYHGSNQPDIRVGTGHGGLRVPDELLEPLRERAAKYK